MIPKYSSSEVNSKTEETKSKRFLNEFYFFRGNLLVLAVSGAFTSLGLGMIGVYLPKYFLALGGDTLTLGLVVAIASIVSFLALLAGGFAADHYGRKEILIATAFYGALFPLLYFILQDWYLFAAAYVLAALGSLSIPAWHATVADSVPPEKRTRGIAALQVFVSLPQAVTPFVWGWLIENFGWTDGFKAGCLYSVGTSFASAFVLGAFLRETLKKSSEVKPNFLNNDGISRLSEVGRSLSSSLKALIVAYALVMFANAAVGQYYIIYATDIISLSAFQWSIIISLQFLLGSLLKIPGGWAADKFGKKNVLLVSVLCCAPFTILFTFSRSFVQVLVVLLLLVAAGIYYGPAHEALQADLTPRAKRGRTTALWSIGSVIGAASGVLVGGWLFRTAGPDVPFYLFTAAELTAFVFLLIGVKEPLTKEV